MGWTASTWWWLITVALVAAELATGTFYLLMLAVGAAAAALAGHLGLGSNGQLILGALVGIAAVALWHTLGPRARRSGMGGDPDLHLDVGSLVRVEAWSPDGTARVQYRGAGWDARFAGSGAPEPGEHVIRAVAGNQLMLDRAPR